jgi:protein gp37
VINSKIEWTDATWNPVRGCTKVSAGCAHCYAETLMERFRGVPGHPFEHGFDLRLVPEHLHDPLTWKRPRRIFVNSLSDLFHEEILQSYLEWVCDVMLRANWHVFQVLTKRAGRMAAMLKGPLRTAAKAKHIWWGVSVENQQAADERVPLLLQAPAAVRFVSCEPLLGPVDLRSIHAGDAGPDGNKWMDALVELYCGDPTMGRGLDWVIVGGESGRGARPMHPQWARDIRDQCSATGTPFFFKQWGEWSPDISKWVVRSYNHDGRRNPYRRAQPRHDFGDGAVGAIHGTTMYHVGKRAAGRLLDGREWDEVPW